MAPTASIAQTFAPKIPIIVKRKVILHLRDNTKPSNGRDTHEKIVHQICIFLYPPLTLDNAPSDYHLFGSFHHFSLLIMKRLILSQKLK